MTPISSACSRIGISVCAVRLLWEGVTLTGSVNGRFEMTFPHFFPALELVSCPVRAASDRPGARARAFDGTLEDSHGEPSSVRKTTVCFDKNRADPWLKRPSLTLSSMP